MFFFPCEVHYLNSLIKVHNYSYRRGMACCVAPLCEMFSPFLFFFFLLLVQRHIDVGCNHTSEKLIRGFYQCAAWEVSEPLAESANGRRGVGIKVDVGEPNSSCLCWITQLYISLWSGFQAAGAPGTAAQRSGIWFLLGECCNSQGLPFSGSGLIV